MSSAPAGPDHLAAPLDPGLGARVSVEAQRTVDAEMEHVWVLLCDYHAVRPRILTAHFAEVALRKSRKAAPSRSRRKSLSLRCWCTNASQSNTCSYKLPGMSDPDAAQRLVLSALLDVHPRLMGIDELTASLADVPRVPEALRVLVDDGLATRLGDHVGVSRAAVRFAVLGPT